MRVSITSGTDGEKAANRNWKYGVNPTENLATTPTIFIEFFQVFFRLHASPPSKDLL